MNRLEALSAAREHVAKINAVPIKPNGYPLDGWKSSSAAEINRMVLETAEFLLAGDPVSTVEGPLAPSITERDALHVAEALDGYREQGYVSESTGLNLKTTVMEILDLHAKG